MTRFIPFLSFLGARVADSELNYWKDNWINRIKVSGTEDSLVEQPVIQSFPYCDGKSSMFSHQNCLHSIYAIT